VVHEKWTVEPGSYASGKWSPQSKDAPVVTNEDIHDINWERT